MARGRPRPRARALSNVVAVVAGASRNVIVVMAHRDNTDPARARTTTRAAPPRSSSSPVPTRRPQAENQPAVEPRHTLVFLSTDAGTFGGLGAARFVDRSLLAGRVVAVLNLDALAGAGPPRIEIAGERPRSPSETLVLTAARRVLEQSGDRPDHRLPRPAYRPGLPVHPLRAGPVRRQGSRQSRSRAAGATSLGRRRYGRRVAVPASSRSSGGRRRSCSARSTRASGWTVNDEPRLVRRSGAVAAGRSNSC